MAAAAPGGAEEENRKLRSDVDFLRRLNDAIVAEVKALKKQGSDFERRLAALEERGGPNAGAAAWAPGDTWAGGYGFCAPEAPCETAHSTLPAASPPTPAPEPTAPKPAPEPTAQAAPKDGWAVSSARVEMYKGAFRKADRNSDGLCEQSDVYEVLDRAGLPDDGDAPAIWRLADVHRRGRLAFGEFACAMYLAFCKSKQGVPLPAQLPPELLELAMSSVSATPEATGAELPPSLAGTPPLPAAQAAAPLTPWPAAPQPPQPPQVPGQEDASGTGSLGHPSRTGAEPAVSSAPAIPAFFETTPGAADPFDQAMSIKELKARLTQHGVSFVGLSEKSELLALLKQVEGQRKIAPSQQAAAAAAAQGRYIPEVPNPTESMFPSAPDPFSGFSTF